MELRLQMQQTTWLEWMMTYQRSPLVALQENATLVNPMRQADLVREVRKCPHERLTEGVSAPQERSAHARLSEGPNA